jgi:hypothetical protein
MYSISTDGNGAHSSQLQALKVLTEISQKYQ